MMAKRRPKTAPLRVWLIRGGIGLALGLFAGFGLGALGVRMLQPAGVAPAEPAVDSTRKSRGPSAVSEEPAADADADQPKNGITVPQLVGMEEGDARQAILRAGFTIGSVTFKAGVEPLGTVVTSFPVPGESVVLPATVNLILSDGKGRPDSTTVPSPVHNNLSELPDAS